MSETNGLSPHLIVELQLINSEAANDLASRQTNVAINYLQVSKIAKISMTTFNRVNDRIGFHFNEVKLCISSPIPKILL